MTGYEPEQWAKDNSPDKRKVVAHLAYMRIRKAEHDLREFIEIANRTEGKSRYQSLDLNSMNEKTETPSEKIFITIQNALKKTHEDS